MATGDGLGWFNPDPAGGQGGGPVIISGHNLGIRKVGKGGEVQEQQRRETRRLALTQFFRPLI